MYLRIYVSKGSESYIRTVTFYSFPHSGYFTNSPLLWLFFSLLFSPSFFYRSPPFLLFTSHDSIFTSLSSLSALRAPSYQLCYGYDLPCVARPDSDRLCRVGDELSTGDFPELGGTKVQLIFIQCSSVSRGGLGEFGIKMALLWMQGENLRNFFGR